MEVLDGWITGVFLGSSRHEIIGSVEKKKLQTSYCVIHIKYTNIMWGWGLEVRASEILSGCCIRRFCAMHTD